MDKVLEHIIRGTCFYEGEIRPENNLFTDLGYDSLSIMALGVGIEESIIGPRDIPNEVILSWRTVQNVIDSLRKNTS